MDSLLLFRWTITQVLTFQRWKDSISARDCGRLWSPCVWSKEFIVRLGSSCRRTWTMSVVQKNSKQSGITSGPLWDRLCSGVANNTMMETTTSSKTLSKAGSGQKNLLRTWWSIPTPPLWNAIREHMGLRIHEVNPSRKLSSLPPTTLTSWSSSPRSWMLISWLSAFLWKDARSCCHSTIPWAWFKPFWRASRRWHVWNNHAVSKSDMFLPLFHNQYEINRDGDMSWTWHLNTWMAWKLETSFSILKILYMQRYMLFCHGNSPGFRLQNVLWSTGSLLFFHTHIEGQPFDMLTMLTLMYGLKTWARSPFLDLASGLLCNWGFSGMGIPTR